MIFSRYISVYRGNENAHLNIFSQGLINQYKFMPHDYVFGYKEIEEAIKQMLGVMLRLNMLKSPLRIPMINNIFMANYDFYDGKYLYIDSWNVLFLLKCGIARANYRTECNQNLLIIAIRHYFPGLYGTERKRIINILIDGAKESGTIDATNDKGETALFGAVEYGDKQSMINLINARCNVNHHNNDLFSPLGIAAYNNEIDKLGCMKLLIENKADVGQICEFPPGVEVGNTILHVTAMRGMYNVVKLLLKYHADPNALNKKNKTPLCLVIKGIDRSMRHCEYNDKDSRYHCEYNDKYSRCHYNSNRTECYREYSRIGSHSGSYQININGLYNIVCLLIKSRANVEKVIESGCSAKITDNLRKLAKMHGYYSEFSSSDEEDF